MKPNTRLLIRFTLPNGDMKSWGYDEPYFKSVMQLQQAIIDDFKDWPANTGIHMFYHDADRPVTTTDNYDLAEQAGNWLLEQGVAL